MATELRVLRHVSSAGPASMGMVCGLAITLLSGIALASTPTSTSVIHGCYDRDTGVLRVLDVSVATCASSEATLDWNRRGPAGPAGVSGLRYIGPLTKPVRPTCAAPDCVDGVWVDCPHGTRAIGGGYRVSEIPPSVVIRASFPLNGTSYTGTRFSSWVVDVKNSDAEAHFISLYAICVRAS